jgi:hypothetical protein
MATSDWNNLPHELMEAETLESFKRGMDIHWKSSPILDENINLGIVPYCKYVNINRQ